MTQALSLDGCLLVWKLFPGAIGEAAEIGKSRGWSAQVEGDLQGGSVLFEASNNGGNFYPIEAVSANGLFEVSEKYRWYRPSLIDAGENARVTITVYTY